MTDVHEIPPLPRIGPHLLGATEDSHNPWKASNAVFSLNCRNPGSVNIPAGIKATIARSPFRIGEARLDKAGIHLLGTAAKTHFYLKWLTMLGYILLWLSGPITRSFPPGAYWMAALYMVLVLTIIFVPSAYMEYCRIPFESEIAWEDIIDVQIGVRPYRTVLIYRSHPVKAGPVEGTYFLAITDTQPGLVDAWAEALEGYVPDRIRGVLPRRFLPAIWTPGLIVMIILISTVILGTLAFVIYEIGIVIH